MVGQRRHQDDWQQREGLSLGQEQVTWTQDGEDRAKTQDRKGRLRRDRPETEQIRDREWKGERAGTAEVRPPVRRQGDGRQGEEQMGGPGPKRPGEAQRRRCRNKGQTLRSRGEARKGGGGAKRLEPHGERLCEAGALGAGR